MRQVVAVAVAVAVVLASGSGARAASPTVPDAPTRGWGAGGDGQLTVNFDAPSSDGGAPITSYTVTASPGGATATGTGSPITVGGGVADLPGRVVFSENCRDWNSWGKELSEVEN